MKTLPTEAVDALAGGELIIAAAMKFVFNDTYRVWSGIGNVYIDGDAEPYSGIDARALIMPLNSNVGGAADGISIEVSSLDPDVAQAIEDESYHQKPVVIYRLVFASDRRTLLGAGVFLRGRVDTVTISETIGGDASIQMAIEGPRRDMARSGARLRSDTDQRALGGSIDGALRHIGVTGRKTLSWGGKPTTAANSLPGAGRISTGSSLAIRALLGR